MADNILFLGDIIFSIEYGISYRIPESDGNLKFFAIGRYGSYVRMYSAVLR